MASFKKGDRVQWTAGGRGGSHIISGVITNVAIPGYIPQGFKGSRPHKSYIVKDADGRIYWPRVASIRAAI